MVNPVAYSDTGFTVRGRGHGIAFEVEGVGVTQLNTAVRIDEEGCVTKRPVQLPHRCSQGHDLLRTEPFRKREQNCTLVSTTTASFEKYLVGDLAEVN